ncbi:hypothetical protein PoB_005262600 [Plakobranchus ocellatus]|uniref:Transmembrane protein n=1 Tax=Plakobranchus ocellatus TaxID=259542 RepID=A0AAV4C021_9GAST|nr:hypothetical protein PoB_005262600 [Plakobranchus ocellatus]
MYTTVDEFALGWDHASGTTSSSFEYETNNSSEISTAGLTPDMFNIVVSTITAELEKFTTDPLSSQGMDKDETQTKRPCLRYCDMSFKRAKFIMWVFSVIVIPSVVILGEHLHSPKGM